MFGALLEFALVNYASRSDKHRERMKEQAKKWEMEAGLAEERPNTFAMVRRKISRNITLNNITFNNPMVISKYRARAGNRF